MSFSLYSRDESSKYGMVKYLTPTRAHSFWPILTFQRVFVSRDVETPVAAKNHELRLKLWHGTVDRVSSHGIAAGWHLR